MAAKRKTTGRAAASVKVVEVETARLEQLDLEQFVAASDGETADSRRVAGAYVKVQATLSASERETFDPAIVKRALIVGGARGVVVDVGFLPEVPRRAVDERIGRSPSPEAAVAGWFAEVRGVPDDERDEAETLALTLVRRAEESE